MDRASLTPEQYREAVLRARAMTPEERIIECFRLSDEYMRSLHTMSEAERQRWREARKKEDDQIYGPPILIAELLRASRSVD